MDWLALVDQVAVKDKETIEKEISSSSSDESCEELAKPEGDLSDLEIAGLLCILNGLSLQLSILYMRTPDSGQQSTRTSAKKLHEILEKTIAQLRETGTFGYLYETVKEEVTRRKADLHVEKASEENEKRISHLQMQIRSNDKIKIKNLNKKQEIIASLKDQIQNLIATSESKIRYIDRRENARQGENLIRCENKEIELKNRSECLIDRYNNEIIVNDKICEFLSVQRMALESELDQWKERYKREMQTRNERIKHLQGKVREQQFKLQKLKKLFNDRQKEMEEYLVFKEEIKAEEERDRFVNDSATKIQAWWRGTMVRRGLGPYKKRKKAMKDKKKKDK